MSCDWGHDEIMVRLQRCEVGGCVRRATWFTEDFGDVRWLCDECCQEVTVTGEIAAEEIDP